MKKIKYLIGIVLLGSLAFNFIACKSDDGGDPEPEDLTAQQKAAQKLSQGSAWEVASVDDAPDGLEEDDYSGLLNLKVTFGVSGSGTDLAPGAFSASGANDFLASDAGATWNWSGNGTSTIELTDASTSQLTGFTFNSDSSAITFTFNVGSEARIKEVAGDFTVTLQ